MTTEWVQIVYEGYVSQASIPANELNQQLSVQGSDGNTYTVGVDKYDAVDADDPYAFEFATGSATSSQPNINEEYTGYDPIGAVGTYFNYVEVDLPGNVTIQSPPPSTPDLQFLGSDSTSVSPNTVAQGGTVNFTYTITNVGSANSGATTLQEYISSSSVLNTSTATKGSTYSLPAIAAGSSLTQTLTLTMDEAPGDYYVAFLDASGYYGWEEVTVTAPAALFTTGADTVDFNNLSAEQKLALIAGAQKYDGLGGDDSVVLPSEADESESIGDNETLGWQDSPSSLFRTSSLAGQTYHVTGTDGNYWVDCGAGTDIITITNQDDATRSGSLVAICGSGDDQISITGNGNNTVTTGTGSLNLSITGYGNNLLQVEGASTQTINGRIVTTANPNIANNGYFTVQFLTGGEASFAGSLSGDGGFYVLGGALTMVGPQTFTGDVYLESATLELTNPTSVGSGTIAFENNVGGSVLQIDGTTMPTNVIAGFTPTETQTIDLRDVAFSGNGAATLLAGNVLQVVQNATVQNGAVYLLNLDPSVDYAGLDFVLTSDGFGGTNINFGDGAPFDELTGGGQSTSFSPIFSDQVILNDTGPDFDTVVGSNGVAYLASAEATVTGGGNTIRLVGATGNVAALYSTGTAWDAVVGSGGEIVLTAALATATGGGNKIYFEGTGDGVSVYATAGVWDAISGVNSLVVLNDAYSQIVGGGNAIYFEGAGNAASLSNTGGVFDTVYGSGNLISLSNAFVEVTGGGNQIDFIGSSGNVAALYNTGTVWDGVTGSNGEIVMTNAHLILMGGGNTIYLEAGGSGNVLAMYNSGASWNNVSGSGALVVLTNSLAAVTGGGDSIYLEGAGNAAALNNTGGVYDVVNGSSSEVALTNAQAEVTGGGNLIYLEGASGNVAALYNTGGVLDGVVGSNGEVIMTNAQASVTGNNNSIYFSGSNSVTASGGSNAFVFQPTIGQDVIGGFASTDTMQFSASDFANWAALQSHIAQSGANTTTITLDANDIVTLDGVTASSLNSANFKFA